LRGVEDPCPVVPVAIHTDVPRWSIAVANDGIFSGCIGIAARAGISPIGTRIAADPGIVARHAVWLL
jgi:hypothetical protein